MTEEHLESRMERGEKVVISAGGVIFYAAVSSVLLILVTFQIREVWSMRLSFWLIMVIFLGSALLHELLHGLGWMLAGRVPFKAMRFGVNWKYLALWTQCTVPVSVRAYRVAVVLPGIFTGILPWLAGILLGSLELAFIGALLTGGASGDAMILLATLKYDGELAVMDLGEIPGFIILDPGEPPPIRSP